MDSENFSSHLETMVARLITSIDRMTEEVRLNNDLIAKLLQTNQSFNAELNDRYQNKARRRRDAW